jgi:transcriptional regulator with XRE-family HTH domain
MINLRLVELRREKGLSQIQVAEHLNITNQAYSLYETNKRQMNYKTLCLLADLFDVSTDYLLGRVDSIPSFLTDEEKDVVDRFRRLDDRGKGSIKSTLDFESTHSATTNDHREKAT